MARFGSPPMGRAVGAATISTRWSIRRPNKRFVAIWTASGGISSRRNGACPNRSDYRPTRPSCAVTTSRVTIGCARRSVSNISIATAISRLPAGMCKRCAPTTDRGSSRSRFPKSITAAASPTSRAASSSFRPTASRYRAVQGKTPSALSSARNGICVELRGGGSW